MANVHCLVTNHPNHETVLVTEGVLDWQAEIAFGWGHCHALMLALKEKTNWIPWGAYDKPEPGYRPNPSPAHVALMRPDGLLVDVDGVWHPDEPVLPEYGPIIWQKLPDPPQWADWWYRSLFEGLPVARTLVDAVLQRAADKSALRVLTNAA